MYSSCMEAAKYIDTHHTNIRYVLAGKQKSAKGSRWLKYEDFERWY